MKNSTRKRTMSGWISAIFLFTACPSAFTQTDYFPYYILINQAEEKFAAHDNPAEALKLYDKAFSDYSKPFVKDLFTAAQIAFYSHDTARFLRYTGHAFDRGMTFRCLHNPNVLAPVFTDTVLLAKLQNSYTRRRSSPIDSVARDSVYRRFYDEQVFKRTINRDETRQNRFAQLEKANTDHFAAVYLSRGIFPSEQFIGLYTDDGFTDFLKRYGLMPFEEPLPAHLAGMVLTPVPEDYSLWNQAAFVSFLHYPCAFQNHREALWKTVKNGYLHPKDYCMLEEWYAAGIDNPAYLNDCVREKQAYYYNITPAFTHMTAKPLKAIEANRAGRYLQKYSVDWEKKRLEKEKGFVFFFGFFNYR